jgi:hypothetical protein
LQGVLDWAALAVIGILACIATPSRSMACSARRAGIETRVRAASLTISATLTLT